MKLDISVVGREFKAVKHPYLWRDVVIYHLGIGAGADELAYVFEGFKGGLRVLPSFAMVAAMEAAAGVLAYAKVDFVRVLHGEQTIRMHAPIPNRGVFMTTPKVVSIRDKGKHAILDVETVTVDGAGAPLFDTLVSLVCRGQGGCGQAQADEPPLHAPPAEQPPDYEHFHQTDPDQAVLYRLSGDLNPLHVNPVLAQAAGYERPILHGLCVYGLALKALIGEFCDGDVSRVREYKARFSRPVYPGDGIHVKAWRLGDGYFALEASSDREVIMNQAYLKIGGPA